MQTVYFCILLCYNFPIAAAGKDTAARRDDMRLFIAINLTSGMKRALLAGEASLRAQAEHGSFTPCGNLHLTLAFIGESRRTSELRRIIAECACPPFEIRLGSPGRFGDLWWAGLEPCDELDALVLRLREKLSGAGFAIDERPFRAHITLARRVRPADIPAPKIPGASMIVKRISLMRSQRRERGMEYTEVFGYDLGRGEEK